MQHYVRFVARFLFIAKVIYVARVMCCRYCFDVTKTMFSSGNITEKMRVAKFDCTGQTVVDLYAGIGYYTLQYLKHTNGLYNTCDLCMLLQVGMI